MDLQVEPNKSKNFNSTAMWSSETNISDYEYNWCCIRPKFCTTCKSWIYIFVFLVISIFIQNFIVNGITSAIISTLEKEFYLSSFQGGLFLAVVDISSVIAAPVIGYLGDLRYINKMRLISVSLLCLSAGSYLIGLTVFMKTPDVSIYSTSELTYCVLNNTLNLTNLEVECLALNIGSTKQQATNIQFILYIGNAIIGIGSVALYTVGVAYIEEIVPPKRSPVCQAIYNGCGAIGGGIGVIITGQFLQLNSRFYLPAFQEQTHLTTSSPNWIGCWWIPWLLYGGMCNLIAVYVYGFPRSIRKDNDSTDSIQTASTTLSELEMPVRVSPAHKKSAKYTSRNNSPKSNIIKKPLSALVTTQQIRQTKFGQFKKNVKFFFIELKQLATNWSFVFLTFAYTTEGLLLTGFLGFIAQYFQFQFQMEASTTTIITGGIALFSVIFGSLLGALLIQKFNWDTTKCALFITIIYFLTSVSFWCILLNCKEVQFTTTSVISNQNSTTSYSCNCDNIYSPVCYKNSTTTLIYQSPCHCGCVSASNNSVYTNCSCLNGLSYNDTTNFVSASNCANGIHCFTNMIIGVMVALVIVFLSAAAFIPMLKAFLGTITVSQQSFALGIKMAVSKILGNVTGPIIYGSALDSTCIYWKTNCYDQKVCELYDNQRMSLLLAIISFLCRFTTFLTSLFAFYFFILKTKRVFLDNTLRPRSEFCEQSFVVQETSNIETKSIKILKTSELSMTKLDTKVEN